VELDRLSPLLAEAPIVLQAVAAWITNLMEEGGAVKRRLQVSSIATYYWSIAYPLLEFFFDEDMAALDSAELEDLYSDSLDIRSSKTRVKRARVLRQFHAFCIARYGFAEVDWYEIEPLIDADTGYIDANIVTPSEYARGMSALQPHLDTANMSAFKLSILMLLMYRAGLRLGEAFRLTLDDFVYDDDTFILLIRGNRYGKPKTANGRRQIHLGWRLPKEERALLLRMIDYRRSLCGDKSETALFGSTAIAHQLDVRKVLEHDLVELLRWATGRRVIRPHHLRHTMGSFCTVSQFDLPAGSYFAQSVSAYFCCAENPGSMLRQALLGSSEQSRRIMHAICAETGHGSPRMLISVYANCLDVALASHLWTSAKETLGDRDGAIALNIAQRGAPVINKYARASALSGLSDARLRRLMHGGIDVTVPAVLAKTILHQNPIGHGVALADPSALPHYEPRWARPDCFTLEQLHGVVAATVGGGEVKRIAQTWAISEGNASRLVASARTLAATCRYDKYGIRAFRNSWNEVGGRSSIKSIPFIPTSKRGGDVYEKFSRALGMLGDPTVRNGLQSWARSYRMAKRGLVCENVEDLQAFWNFLLWLGYESERIVIALPMMILESRKAFEEKLQRIGICKNNVEYMNKRYLGYEDGDGLIAPVVLLKRTKSSALEPAALSMTDFHQCSYLCSVALEFISCSSEVF
jgi:integrase